MKKLGIAGLISSIIAIIGCTTTIVKVYHASNISLLKLTCYTFITTVIILNIINILMIVTNLHTHSLNKKLFESPSKLKMSDLDQPVNNFDVSDLPATVTKIPKYATLLINYILGMDKKYPVEVVHFDTYQVTLRESDIVFNTVSIRNVIFDYSGMTDGEISAFINAINSKRNKL